jgi:type II secretory pathway component PulJ
MSATTLTVLSVLLAVVIIAVLAAALFVVRQSLARTSSTLATLAGALEMVQTEHLKPLEAAVKAINEQFDIIVGAFPGIAAKAKIVADRRPS